MPILDKSQLPSRDNRNESHFNNDLHMKLMEVMDLLEPTNRINWQAYNLPSLMTYTGIRLAEEYEAMTGESWKAAAPTEDAMPL